MKTRRIVSPLWVALGMAGLVAVTLAGVPLTAAPETTDKAPRPSRWERLRGKIVVKDAEYAGNETCALAGCHADTVKTWAGLRHSEHLLSANEWPEDERSCEGCHGPASEHLNDPGHAAIARLGDHPEYVAALCNRCHHSDIRETHFLADVHANAKVSCGTCHDVHRDHGAAHLLRGPGVQLVWRGRRGKKAKAPPAPAAETPGPEAAAPAGGAAPETPAPAPGAAPSPTPMPEAPPASPSAPPPPRKDRGAFTGFPNPRFATAAEKQNTLCLACHEQQRGQFHQNSRHPLFEGRINCTDCHNPHGTGEVSLARHRVDRLCVKCHADKRGPFAFEHDMTTTGEGCLTCHNPHGSPNNNLVKLNGRGVCIQCHNDINRDPEHQLRPGNCWRSGCHVDFHGSQVDDRFLRTGARVQSAPAVHATSSNRAATGVSRPPGHPTSEFSRLLAMLAAAAERREGDEEPERAGAPPAGKVTEARIVEGVRPGAQTGGVLQAQAPPPAASAPSGAPASATPTPGRTTDLEIIGSYQSRGIDGNRSKYWQYTVPPEGFFIDAVRLGFRNARGAPLGTGEWTGIDEPRQTAALRLEPLGPTGLGSALRYEYDRAAFFIEPTLESVNSSDERYQELLWRWQNRATGPELRFIGEARRLDGPGISRLATAAGPGGLRYSVERFGPGIRLPVGDGGLSVAFLRENFEDRSRLLPDAGTNLWVIDYDAFVTPKTTAFASFSFAHINQDGITGDAENRRTRVGVTSALLPRLTGSAELTVDDFERPTTFNAYVRDRDLFVTRLRYLPRPGLSLEGGYERTGLRRVNNAQTFIDTPRWDGGWLSLRALPRDGITFFARHRVRRLRHAPPALIPELPTSLPLYYDDSNRTDAQLTFVLPRDALITLGYGRDSRHNDAREVGFDFDLFSAGLSMPLNRVLTFNADWSKQNWDGRGDVLKSDPLRLNFGRPLDSDGESFSLGLAYLPGRASWTLNLYRFEASGGESTRSQGIALGYEPRWIGWVSPRLQIGWDDYEDRVLSGFDNSDAFFRIDLARRF